MDGMFDRLDTTAFTLVKEGLKIEVTEGFKGVGTWVFADPDIAEKCRKFLPECCGPTEVRMVQLAGPLEQTAEEDKDRPGVWLLKKPAKILDETIREPQEHPKVIAASKKAAKARASATPTVLGPGTDAPPADA